ncbi:hypothetical protein BGW39_008434 [Mortierella sp. 14UC]|nr:hypothetical protein BGW39_008434 [Mortierella sp. 14UC]
MLPTQVLRYFRFVILFVCLIDTGLVIQYWVDIQKSGFDLDFILWDVETSHARLMFIIALVLLVAKSHFAHRYLGELAESRQVCSDGVDRMRCRDRWEAAFALYMGFSEVPCGTLSANNSHDVMSITDTFSRRCHHLHQKST